MKKVFFIISFFALLLLPNFASAATSVSSSNSYYQLQSDAIIYNSDSNAAYGNIKKGTTIESVSLSGNNITLMMGDKKYYINSSSITKIDTPPTQGYSNTETVAGSIVTTQQAEVFNSSDQVIGTINKNLPISYYGMTKGKYQVVFGGNLAYIPSSEAALYTATQSTTSSSSAAPATSSTTSSSTPTTSTASTTAPSTSTTSSKTTASPSTSTTSSSTTSSSTPATSSATSSSTPTTSSATSSSTPATSSATSSSTPATSSATSSSTPATSSATSSSTPATSSTTSSSTPTTSTTTTTTAPKTMISSPMMTSAVAAPQVVYSDYFRVTAENAVVYDSTASPMNELGTLVKGQTFKIEGQSGNYLKISFGKSSGYVSKDAVSPISSPSIDNGNKSYTNSSRVFTPLQDITVYDNKSGDLVPFAVIKKGVKYPIVSDYGNWYRIIVDNRVGYVSKNAVWVDFISTDKYFKTTQSNVPVYDNSTGDLYGIGYLKQDQSYKMVSEYGHWHKIQFGRRYGYVYYTETRPAIKDSIADLNSQYKNSSNMVLALDDTPVYSNQMNHSHLVQFAEIKKGEVHPIVGKYGNWYRVLVSGRVGYVYNKNVKLVQFSNDDQYFKAAEGQIPVYDNQSGDLVKVGNLVKGQTYERVKSYGDWHEIKFGNYYGYVHLPETIVGSKNSIDNLNANAQNSNATFTTIVSAPVYDNESGNLVQFGTISKNTTYSIVSRFGPNWYKVIFANRIGYVRVVNTKLNETGYFKLNVNANIYSSASASSNTIGTLEANQVYKSVQVTGDWYKIQYGDQYGYILKTDTLPDKESNENNWDSGNEPSNGNVTTLQNIAVYDNSSGHLVQFATLPKDTTYPIIDTYGPNWYKVKIADRIGYVSSSIAARKVSYYTNDNYSITLDTALNQQMKYVPQTDHLDGYIATSAIKLVKGVWRLQGNYNLRACPIADDGKCPSLRVLQTNEYVTLESSTIYHGSNYDWYKVYYPIGVWGDSPQPEVKQYLDPLNIINKGTGNFQFLELNHTVNLTADEINATGLLDNAGSLTGTAQDFIAAGIASHVNVAYLISHALHETGNGTSQLARGIVVSSVKGQPVPPKKVYNMYGIAAYDHVENVSGPEAAYTLGWTSVKAAIIGGAKWISDNYLNNSSRDQNTLYKMRWNPTAMQLDNDYNLKNDVLPYQYATNVAWADIITRNMSKLYATLNSYINVYDIPHYQ